MSNFSSFRNIDQAYRSYVVKYFKANVGAVNEVIQHVGGLGGCFVKWPWQVEILNHTGIPITRLYRGEVFGEMSLPSVYTIPIITQLQGRNMLFAVAKAVDKEQLR